MTDHKSLIVRERVIGEDAGGWLNLTDIWKAAGSPSTKTADWRRLPTTEEYLAAIAKSMGFPILSEKPLIVPYVMSAWGAMEEPSDMSLQRWVRRISRRRLGR